MDLLHSDCVILILYSTSLDDIYNQFWIHVLHKYSKLLISELLMQEYPQCLSGVFWKVVYCCHPIDGVWNKPSQYVMSRVSLVNTTILYYTNTILYFYIENCVLYSIDLHSISNNLMQHKSQ